MPNLLEQDNRSMNSALNLYQDSVNKEIKEEEEDNQNSESQKICSFKNS